MINRGAKLVSHLAVLIAVVFTLTACGGGGGGGGTFYDEDDSSSSSSSGGSSSGGETPTLSLALFDAAGEPTDTITSASPGTLTVSIPGGDANVQVSATTEIGTLLPESGTALTNLLGVAQFTIVAGSQTGTGTVTATVNTDDGELTGSLTFNVTTSSMSLALFDPQGNETNTITPTSPGTLRVTIEGGGAGVVVTPTSELAVLSPTTGLTDENGIVEFQVQPGSEQGAGSITVTATTSAGDISGSLAFQVESVGLRMGYFDENDLFIENQIEVIPGPGSTLSAGGDALLSVVVLDENNERITEQVEVIFTSGCINAAQSTISPSNPVTVFGEATTTYSPINCSGTDNFTASIAGTSAQAFGTLEIAAPQTTAIHFISADPEVIALRGTGGAGRSETSNLVFRVIDQSGRPQPGITVDLRFDPESTSVGGMTLSKAQGISNAEGDVTVTVRSGNVPTPAVVVMASVGAGSEKVDAPSSILSVTTGLPEQNSISISTEMFIIPNAANVNNITNTFTVNMDDRYNNKVPGGTAAVFRTEYGSINPSCTTGVLGADTAGLCTTSWSSTAPKKPKFAEDNIKTIYNTNCPAYSYAPLASGPMPCPQGFGFTRGMRSTVMVYAIGEETFVDRNGNGIMDEDEKDLFVNLGEAFEDHNEDGVYTPNEPACIGRPIDDPGLSSQCKSGFGEEFIDFNRNGVYDKDGPSPMYNGLRCPIEGDGVWCSRTLLNVWDDIVITLSDDPSFVIVMVRNALDASAPGTVVTSTTNGRTQTVYISDQYNNAPPAGSTISLSTEGNCEIIGQDNFTVPAIYSQGAYGFTVQTKPEDASGEDGSFSVNFNPVDGAPRIATYGCDVSVAP
ncbi:MAG: hypothetical protein KDI17_17740 [Halioglobus sp.]|nr:hypothetical protein [Halioglobus sp.]